jgi:hypothetical protein
MFQWLRKAYQGTKRVLGKVRSGVETGARIFNKGKDIYNAVKNIASNLPVVGTVAGEAINRFENQANATAKRNIGIDFKDINKAVSTAERVAKYLPSS